MFWKIKKNIWKIGGWSCSLKTADFLFSLVDTRRDMLEKRTTQHQYLDKMDHSDLHKTEPFWCLAKCKTGGEKAREHIMQTKLNCEF